MLNCGITALKSLTTYENAEHAEHAEVRDRSA
jgi:hypothetical protein